MKQKTNICFSILLICSLFYSEAFALVKYDEGSVQVKGIQLLQDSNDPLLYYYVPPFPRLAQKVDGTFELLCMKYVGEKGESSGGLFHALLQFDLPGEMLDSLSKELSKKIPGARIAGCVPLLEPTGKDGEDNPSSFEIVSAIFANKEGKDAFTRSIIASGHAPLTTGSKAAVAALLNQQGATLLWSSLTGTTSDVSVSVNAYYEASVKAYNAIVSAEMEAVYKHFSELQNKQENFKKEQIRKVIDDLQRTGGLKVDVFDRSSGLGIKTGDMDGILKVVTDKLTELMFNSETGWSKNIEKEKAIEDEQLSGRQKQSWFSRAFGGLKNTPYISDEQYVLKNRKEIISNKFYLNLSKTTTIKVPVHSSGNLCGIYNSLEKDSKYFKVINMNDPAFQRFEVHFQIDGEYADAFGDLVNFVGVSFRKKYGNGQEDVTGELYFSAADVKNGKSIQEINFPRLGVSTSDWTNYEYRINWSLKGNEKTLHYPVEDDKWLLSNAPAISLSLPFVKRAIEIDADRSLFKEKQVESAAITFATSLAGEKRMMRKIILRAADADPTAKLFVFQDSNQPIIYQATWYSKDGEFTAPLKIIENDYLYLVPPDRNTNVKSSDK